MKKMIFSIICSVVTGISIAQNVGVGTTSPTEKLDVNGNINVAGTIKANGITGQSGQVLRTSSTGNLEWSDPCNYSRFVSFNVSGSFNWPIPAGVTKVLVEVWGGGGGGSLYGGGGGGGYLKGWFNVTPGNSITGNVGPGGNGGTTQGISGTQTDATVAGYTLYGFGGSGSYYNGAAQSVQGNSGGGFSVNPGASTIIGQKGYPGFPNKISYTQKDATTWLEITEGGIGGDAGNTANTGGAGGYRLRTISADEFRAEPAAGVTPGGGGGGGHLSNTVGGGGATGKVVIWY